MTTVGSACARLSVPMKTYQTTIMTLGFTATLIGVVAKSLPTGNGAEEEPAPHYALHEWGTFTSVFGSDGQMLPGLEREEEHLPEFVYGHDGMAKNPIQGQPIVMKAWQRPLRGVTVKMETPVLYFHSDDAFSAQVNVRFHGGSISQWFPQRSGGEVPPPRPLVSFPQASFEQQGGIDFSKPYEGRIEWEVKVLEKSAANESKAFVGGETPTWLYPRFTDANVVTNGQGEHEKYLFYRGLGNFEQPVRPVFTSDNALRFENTGEESIPYAMWYFREGETFRVRALGPIPAGEAVTIALDDTEADLCEVETSLRSKVYEPLVAALVKEGLYQREADSMVRTWWQSYFERDGCRIFWVVPQQFLKKILPLDVRPAPAEICRVLVGRSDLLTPSFERELVADRDAGNLGERHGTDRFYGAYEARVKQLTALAAAPNVRP